MSADAGPGAVGSGVPSASADQAAGGASPTTRRAFLATSSSAVGGAWLMRLGPVIALTQACARDAMRDGLPFAVFTEREGADFEALSARILPTDDTPGAREAGSVYFADRALETFASDLLPIVRGGLAAMNERVASTFEGETAFADLPEARQDEIVGATEQNDPGFFFFARALVMMGVVCDPSYGGNRDQVGWQLLGFEDAFQYQPPFGYYDRAEHGATADRGDGEPGDRTAHHPPGSARGARS